MQIADVKVKNVRWRCEWESESERESFYLDKVHLVVLLESVQRVNEQLQLSDTLRHVHTHVPFKKYSFRERKRLF